MILVCKFFDGCGLSVKVPVGISDKSEEDGYNRECSCIF